MPKAGQRTAGTGGTLGACLARPRSWFVRARDSVGRRWRMRAKKAAAAARSIGWCGPWFARSRIGRRERTRVHAAQCEASDVSTSETMYVDDKAQTRERRRKD